MSDPDSLYRFNRAIVRRPGGSVIKGLRAADRGAPAYDDVAYEHDQYLAALQAAGVEVQVLPPLEPFPDAIFIEDPALVFSAGAVVLRSRAVSRAGEAAALEPVLQARFATVLHLPGAGFVDGGDVLMTPEGALVGLSSRTDRAGAEALAVCLEEFAIPSRVVSTPPGVLHLKSDCALLDEHTILATPRLARSGIFSAFDVVPTADGEEGAANALRINATVLMADRYPRTLEAVRQRGFDITPLPANAIALLDAGLSCMSLRWFEPAAR